MRKEHERQGYSVLGVYESNTLLITLKNKKNSSPKTRGQGCGGGGVSRSEPTEKRFGSAEKVSKCQSSKTHGPGKRRRRHGPRETRPVPSPPRLSTAMAQKNRRVSTHI